MRVRAGTQTPLQDASTTLITKGTHDGYWDTTTSTFFSGANVYAGLVTGLVCHSFFKFCDVAIPKDATILSAVLTLESEGSYLACSWLVSGDDADFAVAPTSAATAQALTLTTAQVAWSPAVWTTGVKYASPDLSAIVQEIIGRAVWVPGNPIQLVVKDNGSTGYRQIASWEDRATKAVPTLTVTYTTASDSWVGLPAVTGDDGFWTAGASFYSALAYGQFGKETANAATVGHSWFRLPSCPIPKNATILTARLQFAPYSTSSTTTMATLIYGNLATPAVAPTTAAEANALVLTAANVAWAPGTWTAAVEDSAALSPDITTVLQELVNQAGYTPGQAIMLLVKNNGSPNSTRRIWSSLDGGVTVSWPSLTVTWTLPGASSATTNTTMLAANKRRRGLILTEESGGAGFRWCAHSNPSTTRGMFVKAGSTRMYGDDQHVPKGPIIVTPAASGGNCVITVSEIQDD